METVVFGVSAGGLGDQLAYTALPRLYKLSGAKRVLLSTRTGNGEPLGRNLDTRRLLWELNPYLDGFTDDLPTAASLEQLGYNFAVTSKTARTPIETVAIVHGFSDRLPEWKRHIALDRPDLFYTPMLKSEFTSKIVCDPRSISQGFDKLTFERFVDFISKWHSLGRHEIVVLDSSAAGKHGEDILRGNPHHSVQNIFEYTDIIASAMSFLVTESGGQSLAAAVRDSGTYVLMTSRTYNERNFLWPNNNYSVTGQLTPGNREWAGIPES